jgi:hypothetical protein
MPQYQRFVELIKQLPVLALSCSSASLTHAADPLQCRSPHRSLITPWFSRAGYRVA